MPSYISNGGALQELKDVSISNGGQVNKFAKMYVSNGATLAEIYSDMGKKYIYVFHTSRLDNGYIDRIDADTMQLVSISTVGDLSYNRQNLLGDRSYDFHGNMYYVRDNKNAESGSWYEIPCKFTKDGLNITDGLMGFHSMDKTTLDIMNTSSIYGGYPYIDIYNTSDGGANYSLKMSVPQKVTAGGAAIRREGDVVSPIVKTENYIFYATATSEDSEDYCGSRYRAVSRYNLNTMEYTCLIPSNGSSRRSIDHVPFLSHPVLSDHYYSMNLIDIDYLRISNWLQLRNKDGTQVAALELSGIPVYIRPLQDKLLAVVNNQIIEIQLNLSSYRVLCNANPHFMDVEYYLNTSEVRGADGWISGWNINKYNYSGVLIGSTYLPRDPYPQVSAIRYAPPRSIAVTHPELGQ